MTVSLLKSDNNSFQSPLNILVILPGIIPSTIILTIEPLLYLLDLGKIHLKLRLEDFVISNKDFLWADLVVLCRNTEPGSDFAGLLAALSKPYIYELDDNFFELPINLPEGVYHRAPDRLTQLEKYIHLAALVRVYSIPLEMRVRQYNSKVRLLQAPVNLSVIPASPPARRSGKILIVFSTSRTIEDELSKIFVQDLKRVLNEYPMEVEAHFWGYMPEELKGMQSVKFHRFMANYRKYLRVFYQGAYDIGLAPMKNDVFHNSKTNNKFREYGACWIAGIYSNSDVYARCVQDGVTGLLVSNEEGAWYAALKKLITNPQLRKNIQNNARKLVEQQYGLDSFALSLLKDINTVYFTHMLRDFSVTQNEGLYPTMEQQTLPRFVNRSFKMLISRLQRASRYVQKYGFKHTLRLIFELVDRYIRYFALTWKIIRKNSYNQ